MGSSLRGSELEFIRYDISYILFLIERNVLDVCEQPNLYSSRVAENVCSSTFSDLYNN